MPGLPKSRDGCEGLMRNASFQKVFYFYFLYNIFYFLYNMTQKFHLVTNTHWMPSNVADTGYSEKTFIYKGKWIRQLVWKLPKQGLLLWENEAYERIRPVLPKQWKALLFLPLCTPKIYIYIYECMSISSHLKTIMIQKIQQEMKSYNKVNLSIWIYSFFPKIFKIVSLENNTTPLMSWSI